MKELTIKLNGMGYLSNATLYVDGQPVRCRKNEFGNYVAKYRTDHDRVTVQLVHTIDVGGWAWFLTQLVFFLISLFGILDVHHREPCWRVDFATTIDLPDTAQVTLQINPPTENGPVVDVQTTLPYHTEQNQYTRDTHAQRTLRRLLVAKIFLFIAIIAITTIVLMSQF